MFGRKKKKDDIVITNEVLEQFQSIKDTTAENMFDASNILRIAWTRNMLALMRLIQDHPNEYFKLVESNGKL